MVWDCTGPISLAAMKYPNEDEVHVALADALKEEHKAIVDAGFLLQVDDAYLAHREASLALRIFSNQHFFEIGSGSIIIIAAAHPNHHAPRWWFYAWSITGIALKNDRR